MRSHPLLFALAAVGTTVQGLNILITNDDGFASANTRELYKELTALGHSCYVVAPPTDQSDVNECDLFTTSPVLLSNSQWDFVQAGAPSLGPDPHDDHVWYFNGTSTAQVIVALDYILPTFGTFHSPDLVLSGPNFGWTVGPFFYTVSGTVGAAITAIERGIPAIAFSSGNDMPVPYTWVNASTKVGLRDPATITARLASTLVETLVQKANGGPVMPRGYGMTVNFPFITSLTNGSCLNPPYVLTRMSPALLGKAVFNHKTGLF
ncbi:survival protein sure-like phosphatase/nucleotidase, partial [Schizothecium vesticola]